MKFISSILSSAAVALVVSQQLVYGAQHKLSHHHHHHHHAHSSVHHQDNSNNYNNSSPLFLSMESHNTPLVRQVAAPVFQDGTLLEGFNFNSIKPPTLQKSITDVFLKNYKEPATIQNIIEDCGPDPNIWALTYANGPSPNTRKVVANLRKNKIKATFFPLGSSMVQFSGTGSNLNANGHEIAMHTWSHPNLNQLSAEEIVSEIIWNARLIHLVTGKVPRYFRPPYGSANNTVLGILQTMDIVPINWNFDSNDWKIVEDVASQSIPAKDVIDATLARIKNADNGTISLQHDLKPTVTDVVPQINSELVKAKKKLVRLSHCVQTVHKRGAPYATSGKFFKLITDLNKGVSPVSGNNDDASIVPGSGNHDINNQQPTNNGANNNNNGATNNNNGGQNGDGSGVLSSVMVSVLSFVLPLLSSLMTF